MRRWIVPGLPFTVSLGLSLATAGTYPYWQDSGLYLMGVKELGVLYPPGFVLYLALCKLWTLLLFFLDFTLAVHLFSSACAALAAGTMAVAVRDLLRSRGKVFRVLEEEPGALAGFCGMLAGVILASGYTFWSAAIYAKGYALYYLILALLLWRMIRADDSGRRRDFTLVAALIGLAWQAHPSAALAGGALAAFVAVQAKTLGVKGVAGRVGVAAACALGPSLLLLPILMARDPWLRMGHVETFGQFLSYATGQRFVQMEGVFGIDASRVASFSQFLWEEFLGVGLLLTTGGVAVLALRKRRLFLAGIALWTAPYAVVTILFKIEGQHDFWFTAAWLPLYLVLGVGACWIARQAGKRGPALLAGGGLLALLWALLSNLGDVSQRRYDLAELYGRTILEGVDPDAVVLLHGDDPNALAGYLQRVRGIRPDVALITSNYLFQRAQGGSDWYDDALLRRHPFLKRPDYVSLVRRFPDTLLDDVSLAAFLNANAEGGRALFTNRRVEGELLRRDRMLAPAGTLWKLVPRSASPEIEIRYWSFPIEPEEVRQRIRRERGQEVSFTAEGVFVRPQGYEWRLIAMLIKARIALAMAQVERGQYAPAARLLESALALDPEQARNVELLHFLGVCLHMLGEHGRAEPLLKRSSETGTRPEWRATALYYRGRIALAKGDPADARRLFTEALSVPGLGDAYRVEIEKRLKAP